MYRGRKQSVGGGADCVERKCLDGGIYRKMRVNVVSSGNVTI
jgi:hypothetical protein